MLSWFYLEPMIGFNRPITAIVVCTAGINIFKPRAFNVEVQHFMTRAISPPRWDHAKSPESHLNGLISPQNLKILT